VILMGKLRGIRLLVKERGTAAPPPSFPQIALTLASA